MAISLATVGIIATLLLGLATANAEDHVPAQQLKAIGYGTAFAVNSAGEFLTNYHVVKGCTVLRLRWDGAAHDATVLTSDEQNDLAVVRSSGGKIEPLRFREGKGIRPGEGIVVLGFPYSGLLSTSAQVTTGGISALTGIRDDIRFMQLTAPVQPGNSGGPLLDLSGNVVGVVSSRINELAVAEATGSLPQNINFAIKGAVIRTFLDAHQIAYETAPSSAKLEPADVAETATKSTLLVECLNEPQQAIASATRVPSKASSPIPEITGQAPRQRNAILCGQPVGYTINRTDTPAEYLKFLGTWTGNWNNANKICGGLIVERVKPDGIAEIIYVYGPSSATKSFPWKKQTITAQVHYDDMSFIDDQGNRFLFGAETSGGFRGAFFSPSGKLYSSFEKVD
jgi:hypothetical protein